MQKYFKEILFTTEGAEHTEEMIKGMFYLSCLLCVARSASVYSVVQNGFLGGGHHAQVVLSNKLIHKEVKRRSALEK